MKVTLFPFLQNSPICDPQDPQTSFQANEKLENLNEDKIKEDLIKKDDETNFNKNSKKKTKMNGILKKKVAISTITLNGKAKLTRKKENQLTSDSDSESSPQQVKNAPVPCS